MAFRHLAVATALFLVVGCRLLGQGVREVARQAARPAQPILRLDPDGPTSFGRALAFDSQGTLYAGGWDQLVRAWTPKNGRFAKDPAKTIRVPIGPGLNGAINAIATSPDGRWIAVAGVGVARDTAADYRALGRIVPSSGGAMTEQMRLDQGTIYLIDAETREVHSLRGHRGEVLGLQFAPAPDSHLLVSAGVAQYPLNVEGTAVVRLWDVVRRRFLKGSYLDVRRDRVVDPPQIAIQQLGSGNDDLRVAVSWNDGMLRAVDLSRGNVLKANDGDARNKTAIRTSRGLLTGSYFPQSGGGALTFWPNAMLWNAASPMQTGERIGITSFGNNAGLPQSLSRLERGGKEYVVAAVQAIGMRQGRGVPTHMELQLIELGSGAKSREPVFRRALWSSSSRTVDIPAVCVSPDGRFVAIAGGAADHEVQVFVADEMLSNENAQPQVLRSKAARVVDAWFTRRGDSRGIAIRQSANGPETGELVFDLAAGRLDGRGSDWEDDRTTATRWTASVEDFGSGGSQLQRVRLDSADGPARVIQIPEGQEAVTAHALIGTSDTLPTPLLAIASHQKGQPMLSILDASTGHQIRQFTGHTERIDSLSSSSDGRFLVSTAHDHMVCVWSLDDLSDTLGRHGLLRGVKVRQSEDGSLVVADVGTGSSASGLLLPNDELLGYSQWGVEHDWKEPDLFYKTWWNTEPGTRLAVRIRRGGQDQTVDLVADQGIDERKPLFSVFLAKQGGGQSPPWIGWSPLGLFESSDREVERFLGWHFNTGNEDNPTLFVDLGEYRDDFYRRGLLNYLITHAELPPAEPDRPAEPPKITLRVYHRGAPAHSSSWDALVRQTEDLSLVMAIAPPYRQSMIDTVECLVDGVSVGEMKLNDSGLLWELDLPDEHWERGKHELTAVVKTTGTSGEQYSANLQLRYQPLPPQLVIESRPDGIVRDEEFLLKANVWAREDAKVDLFATDESGSRRKIHTWTVAEGQSTLSKALSLDVGRHQFDVIARNAEALESFEDVETTGRSLIVRRAEQMARLPKIAVQLDDAAIRPEEISTGQVVRIDSARFAIHGKLEQARDVASVSVRFGSEGQRAMTQQLIDVIGAGDERSFTYTGENWPPGVTKVWIEVATTAGAKVESYFIVDYQPPLPLIEITQPSSGNDLWFEESQERVVSLEAVLLLPDHAETREDVIAQLKTSILVNGRPISSVPIVDYDTGLLSAEVPVDIGDNQLSLQLDLGSAQAKEEVFLTCYEALEGKTVMPEKVHHAIRLLEIPDALEPVRVADATTGRALAWRRSADGVDLNLNDVPADGFVARVHFPRLPAVDFRIAPVEIPRSTVPPEIAFLAPEQDGQIPMPNGVIEFAVESETDLTRVEIQHISKYGRRETAIDVKSQEKRDGRYVLQHSFHTPLDSGLNTFTVFAESEGGSISSPLNVTRVQPPVALYVERLQPAGGNPIRNTSVYGTPLFPAPSPSAQATMHGYLELSDAADDKWRSGRHYVHTWVNGFQQLPAKLQLEESGDKVRLRFKIPVLLSGPENLVQLSVAGLPRESRQQSFQVRCAQPLKDQRLHLLLIGATQSAGRAELIDNALETLQLKPFGVSAIELASGPVARYETKPNSEGQRHVFREVFLYRPLTGVAVNNRTVSGHLWLVHKTIVDLSSRRSNGSRANDVVVVYYAGSEELRNDGRFHLTTGAKNQLLSSDVFSRFVRNTLGAHLLLLDVNRASLAGGPLPMTEGISILRLAKPESHTMLTSLLANASPPPTQLREFDSELRQRVQSVPGFPRTIQYDGMVSSSMENLRLVPE